MSTRGKGLVIPEIKDPIFTVVNDSGDFIWHHNIAGLLGQDELWTGRGTLRFTVHLLYTQALAMAEATGIPVRFDRTVHVGDPHDPQVLITINTTTFTKPDDNDRPPVDRADVAVAGS